jgi:hypothetical protein
LMADIKYRIIQLSEISQAIRHQLILPFAHHHAGHPIGGKFDPLFGSTSDAQAYVENIKREIEVSYTSNEIKRPFYGAFMMNVPAIDPSTISWDDVIALRRDEEILAEWRTLIHEILDELYSRRDDFTDIAGEFEDVAKEKFRAWNAKLSVQPMRRTAFSALLQGGKEVIVGLTGGTLAALAMGAPPATAVAVGAALREGTGHAGPPIISMLSEVWRAISLREERISLEHHLLALSL